ncbi:MAG: hypothetical protein QG574_1188 [Cyanobacteriota bacterium erpe_2018_sw_21hr_WHONDRS-SW48-000092_B_bin.40]|nr:hypothetical protein [Cyanobacteriota bacterium erpe_2018_sw_21hr_WHONDRS-SW48-000092_B_bin.40]
MGSPANENLTDKANNKNIESHDTSKNHSEGQSHLQEEAYELLSKVGQKASKAAMSVLDFVVDIVAPVKARDVALANLSVMKPGPIAIDGPQKIDAVVIEKLDREHLERLTTNRETQEPRVIIPSAIRGMAKAAMPATAPAESSKAKPENDLLPNLEIDGLTPSHMRKTPALKAAN